MTISQMLSQSGMLTLLGMGVVFSFLIILILSMYLLHAVVHALRLDKADEPDTASAAPAAPSQAADTGAVVAAIAAAVHEKLG
ncbi:MAG: OadG family protein [Treponema sp.]|jgi:oxaloacetate decarboxylase gamma subunit|nr:OadG family protein [Treponema sp.]